MFFTVVERINSVRTPSQSVGSVLMKRGGGGVDGRRPYTHTRTLAVGQPPPTPTRKRVILFTCKAQVTVRSS